MWRRDGITRSCGLALLALAATHSAAGPVGGPGVPPQSASAWTERWAEDWKDRWTHRRLADRATDYRVVESTDGRALLATSRSSASALWHPLDLPVRQDAVIRWHWKVSMTYEGNARERHRDGDDYPARLFVLFDEPGFDPGARAINYVWASTEPVGSLYPNPYFDNVATIVVASGTAEVGDWTAVEREFVRDYTAAFGELPSAVTGVALMVDSDDTAGRATTWFGPLQIRYRRRTDPP